MPRGLTVTELQNVYAFAQELKSKRPLTVVQVAKNDRKAARKAYLEAVRREKDAISGPPVDPKMALLESEASLYGYSPAEYFKLLESKELAIVAMTETEKKILRAGAPK